MRGGALSTWTSILSSTDRTFRGHVLRNIIVDMGTDETFSDLQEFRYGGALYPNDIPWLAD